MNYEFWKAAYEFGWASPEQIQEAAVLGLITQEEASQIIGTTQ
ncbi:XkdX family protein [Aneurinibacillus sp. UBA3580]|jgi:uncharacterized XkdX family phage protein|nr:XkdX family protein [Aneurinibacillus sp. UBA3580]